MAPPKGHVMKRSNNLERCQALSMLASGQTPNHIETVVGITPAALSKMLTKAKNRGYVPGGKILEDHICDGKPSNIKGTVVDPSDTPTPRKTVKKAAKKAVKLEPQAELDSDMSPSQPEGSGFNLSQPEGSGFNLSQPEGHGYNLDPIPFNLQQPNPFKLEPMEYDQDDYSL
jgi:hypothetical protein